VEKNAHFRDLGAMHSGETEFHETHCALTYETRFTIVHCALEQHDEWEKIKIKNTIIG
jgi:hypothetical protein